MTDIDAAGYIRELMEYNAQSVFLTPKNNGFDTFFQCAMSHALRALEERAGVHNQVFYQANPNGSYTAVVSPKDKEAES